MKIVYEYGIMFVLHPSGNVDTYDRDSLEAQRVIELEQKDRAVKRIHVICERLAGINGSVSGIKTETPKVGRIKRLIRRIRNEIG